MMVCVWTGLVDELPVVAVDVADAVDGADADAAAADGDGDAVAVVIAGEFVELASGAKLDPF